MNGISRPRHAALRSLFLPRKGNFARFMATRIGASQMRNETLGRLDVRVNWAAGETLWTKARQQGLWQSCRVLPLSAVPPRGLRPLRTRLRPGAYRDRTGAPPGGA